MPVKSITVDYLSFVSLLLQTRCNGLPLAHATGFVVTQGEKDFLFTNWHVLAGRDAETLKPLSDTAALPDEVAIYCHTVSEIDGQRRTGWSAISQPLVDDKGNARWIEHQLGHKVDVAALPIPPAIQPAAYYPLDLALEKTNLFAGPGQPVSIIGYPFGLTGGALFPIWKTGHIASEPEVDYDDLPIFLVDATTRSGMSGSPVIRRFAGFGYRARSGVEMMSSNMVRAGLSELTRFMGIYAGRIRDDAEIGRVWKAEVIGQILQAKP